MRASSPILALLLVLAILMALPSIVTLPRVHAVTQLGDTRWSPFGPQEQNLIISVYGSFQSMFNDFTSGRLDITDWPVPPGNLGFGVPSSYCDSAFNPDFFCTTPVAQVGVFDLQINSHGSIMGIPLTSPRFPSPASITVAGSSTACSTGFGSLTIILENQETGNSLIKDQYNTVKVANQPSGSPSTSVSDSGGTSPSGIYKIPCLLAGSYLVSTSTYGGSALATISSGQNTVITFHVNWNSISNVNITPARTFWGAALAHMIDMPNFVANFYGSSAVADNTFDPGDSVLTPPTLAQLTAADCFFHGNLTSPDLHPWASQCSSYPNGGNDVSAYNMVTDSVAGGSVWWQTTGLNVVSYFGYSGHQDLRAACDDLVSMGLSLTTAAGSGGCENVANALSNSTLPAPWTSTNYPHVVPNGNIIFYTRSSEGRKQLSTIVADTLNAIFGSPSSAGGGTVCYGNTTPGNPSTGCVTTPKFYNIGQTAPIVFGDGPVSSGGNGPDGWNLYPGFLTTTSQPDYPWALFNSEFSGGNCYTPGGTNPPGAAESTNYVNYCDPQLDTYTSQGEFSPATINGAIFSQAIIDGMMNGMDVPSFSFIQRNVELNGWNFQQCTGAPCANTQSSLVNTIGLGTEDPFWTLLNARQVPGYIPVNSSFVPGGGNPHLIRMGFSETISHLSPFQAASPWETNVVSEVYDSMLQINPLTYVSSGQLIDWQTTSHTISYNPIATCNSPATGPVVGCTTQIWHLRNDLKFQDRNPVTANDVAYSLLAERDVPAAIYSGNVFDVVSAAGLDCGMGQPCKTLQVVVALQSPFDEFYVGTAPILEQALWQPYCGVVMGPGGYAGNGIPSASTSQCASLSFDPMTANNPLTNTPGIFVGDGPFSCIVPSGFPNAGHVGGSCTETASNTLEGQTVDVGGRVLLQRNRLYFRCCPGDSSSSLYKFSWADVNNDGIVNIEDLSSAAACFGIGAGSHGPLCTAAQSSYWVNPNIAPGGSVNITDLATVAYYFGAGLTSYGGVSNLHSLTGIDPQIDPFNCPTTGC